MQAQCLTAAGLNPKFLATKDEVMQLIGDRQHVLEGELRRRMGNNPDTSKALRCSSPVQAMLTFTSMHIS